MLLIDQQYVVFPNSPNRTLNLEQWTAQTTVIPFMMSNLQHPQVNGAL